MRVEPYEVGSVVHVTKRGARGMNIVRGTTDKERFKRALFYLNDEFQNRSMYGWEEDTRTLTPFTRPPKWPAHTPLVKVLAWVLMPNHFHLILEEIQEGGISKFMQRLGGSMSSHFNTKYGEQGSVFQGSFKSRTIDSDEYLRYCAPYVMVKNLFELAPGGLKQSARDFERAWRWALLYPYSSMPVYGASAASPIVADTGNILKEIFPSAEKFKEAGRDMLLAHAQHRFGDLKHLFLEEW